MIERMNRAGRQDEGIAIGPAAATKKCVRLLRHAGLQNAISHKIGGMHGSGKTKARQRRGPHLRSSGGVGQRSACQHGRENNDCENIYAHVDFCNSVIRLALFAGSFQAAIPFIVAQRFLPLGARTAATHFDHSGIHLRLLLTSVLFVACAENKISHVLCDLLPLPRDSESGPVRTKKMPMISTEIRYQFLVLIKKVHFLV